MTEDSEAAKEQAESQVESIVELMDAYKKAQKEGRAVNPLIFYSDEEIPEEDKDTPDQIMEDIRNFPLSVQVREGWKSPGANAHASEFEILLCTGGPAVRIIGDIGVHGTAVSVDVQYQDWFIPWESIHVDGSKEDKLLDFCNTFYLGG